MLQKNLKKNKEKTWNKLFKGPPCLSAKLNIHLLVFQPKLDNAQGILGKY